jgi:hypothetical protein
MEFRMSQMVCKCSYFLSFCTRICTRSHPVVRKVSSPVVFSWTVLSVQAGECSGKVEAVFLNTGLWPGSVTKHFPMCSEHWAWWKSDWAKPPRVSSKRVTCLLWTAFTRELSPVCVLGATVSLRELYNLSHE